MEGILFSFHENNGVNMVEWVSASVIPRWAILLPYTSNYKNWKDKFFRVKVSAYYPEIMYEEDETHKFPLNCISIP